MECEKAELSRKAVSLLKAKLCEKASSNHVFSAEWEYTIEKPKLEGIETDSKHSPNLNSYNRIFKSVEEQGCHRSRNSH